MRWKTRHDCSYEKVESKSLIVRAERCMSDAGESS